MSASLHNVLFRPADEANDNRLFAILNFCQHLLLNALSRRLGDQHDHLRLFVVVKCFHTVQHHDAADLLCQISPASSNQLGYTAAKVVNANADLLAACTGCADDADIPFSYLISETKSDISNNSGSTIRPHHQQAFFMGQLLEFNFILDADVVAEQHDVQIVLQRFASFSCRKCAIDGNDSQIRIRYILCRRVNRWELNFACTLRGCFLCEQFLNFSKCIFA
ncbi:hypothetical protein D3C77_340950 [compost metagenome]